MCFWGSNAHKARTALCSAGLARSDTDTMTSFLPWPLSAAGHMSMPAGCLAARKKTKKVHSFPSASIMLQPRVKIRKQSSGWSDRGLTCSQKMFVHLTDTEVRCGLGARCAKDTGWRNLVVPWCGSNKGTRLRAAVSPHLLRGIPLADQQGNLPCAGQNAFTDKNAVKPMPKQTTVEWNRRHSHLRSSDTSHVAVSTPNLYHWKEDRSTWAVDTKKTADIGACM